MAIVQWDVDSAHSSVGFAVRHLVISKVRGQFNKFSATLAFDPADPATANIQATIDAASIDTREAQRDAHLRSADFLDAEKFPTLAFKSGRVEKGAGNRLRVFGDLTIHGVTKEVTLDVDYEGERKDPWGNQRVGFAATTAISRADFGLTWNQALEAGGVLVGDKVEIQLEIEAIQKK